jgi:precorrin-4/cobalt-precorrin-4 C11-methyltransferase
MTVFFIGAGPGDPELITVKGQRLVRSCPVILYAGSLVPAAVLEGHVAEQVVNTAELDLDEIIAFLTEAHNSGKDVARVHSGDPSLYGAIGEQIRRLRELQIPYEIVPGVTATAACAAALGCELTLPDVSQTLIAFCQQDDHAGRGAARRSGASSCNDGNSSRRAASGADR